jgi:hypothetical protein
MNCIVVQYINTLINIEYVYYIQHGEIIPYRNTTIQYINTLINIEYVHYICIYVLYSCISACITSPCCM